MRNWLIVVLVGVAFPSIALGQLFDPSISVSGCFTHNQFKKEVDAGIFETNNRKGNLGFELANEFGLGKHHFLRTGIRFQSFQTTISALNQMPQWHNKPDPFVWTKTYNSVTIPILIGRNFQSQTGPMGKVYLGVSAGLFSNSMSKGEVSTGVLRNITTTDTFSLQSTDTIGLLKPRLIATLDLGGSYQPFKKWPRFFVGMFMSYQLTLANAGFYSGQTENISQGLIYPYKGSFFQRSMHLGISLQYYFKKRQNLTIPHETACR